MYTKCSHHESFAHSSLCGWWRICLQVEMRSLCICIWQFLKCLSTFVNWVTVVAEDQGYWVVWLRWTCYMSVAASLCTMPTLVLIHVLQWRSCKCGKVWLKVTEHSCQLEKLLKSFLKRHKSENIARNRETVPTQECITEVWKKYYLSRSSNELQALNAWINWCVLTYRTVHTHMRV